MLSGWIIKFQSSQEAIIARESSWSSGYQALGCRVSGRKTIKKQQTRRSGPANKVFNQDHRKAQVRKVELSRSSAQVEREKKQKMENEKTFTQGRVYTLPIESERSHDNTSFDRLCVSHLRCTHRFKSFAHTSGWSYQFPAFLLGCSYLGQYFGSLSTWGRAYNLTWSWIGGNVEGFAEGLLVGPQFDVR